MTKYEFLGDLSRLLSDLPEEERKQAMRYYEDYFADAGEEQEEAVMEELGSPAELAQQIKEGTSEQIHYGEGVPIHSKEVHLPSRETAQNTSNTSSADGNTEETGWQKGPQPDSNTTDNNTTDSNTARNNATGKSTTSGGTNRILLIILLVILTSPVWGTVLITAGSLAIGIAATLFGILCAFLFGSLGIAIGGIGCIIGGIVACFTPEIASGILTIGIGLILLALGSVFFYGTIIACSKLFPLLFSQLGTMLNWCSQKVQSLFA